MLSPPAPTITTFALLPALFLVALLTSANFQSAIVICVGGGLGGSDQCPGGSAGSSGALAYPSASPTASAATGRRSVCVYSPRFTSATSPSWSSRPCRRPWWCGLGGSGQCPCGSGGSSGALVYPSATLAACSTMERRSGCPCGPHPRLPYVW